MIEKEFRERVVPLQRLMYGIALRMGIPPDDAADTVQETLIRLWRHRDGIPLQPGETRLYCLGAFRNECLTWLRRKRAAVPLEEAGAIAADDSPQTEYRDTRRRIEVLIDTLPGGQREVIRLQRFRWTRQPRDSRGDRPDREQCTPAPLERTTATQGVAR